MANLVTCLWFDARPAVIVPPGESATAVLDLPVEAPRGAV
jgi:hypothetical protein